MVVSTEISPTGLEEKKHVVVDTHHAHMTMCTAREKKECVKDGGGLACPTLTEARLCSVIAFGESILLPLLDFYLHFSSFRSFLADPSSSSYGGSTPNSVLVSVSFALTVT